jgi:hypothetical protein
MPTSDIASYVAFIVAIGSGIFAVVKWADQRKRELEGRRFEQYWKLIDVAQESQKLAKQQIALLLLKRFPDFKAETAAFLAGTEKLNDPWFRQNANTIKEVLTALKS